MVYDGIPYNLAGGQQLCCGASAASVAQTDVGKWRCQFSPCDKSVAQASLRSHVAAHVLRLNKSDPGHASEPCGFCGDVTSGCIAMVTDKCPVTLKPCALKACTSSCKNGNGSLFGIKSALKYNTSNPNTNVPIKCPICPGVRFVWKYNWIGHLDSHHPNDASKAQWITQKEFQLMPSEADQVLKTK